MPPQMISRFFLIYPKKTFIIKNGDYMNTYFNEITSAPVNTTDGKVLYKIPAGAFCSNGDTGVVFDND